MHCGTPFTHLLNRNELLLTPNNVRRTQITYILRINIFISQNIIGTENWHEPVNMFEIVVGIEWNYNLCWKTSFKCLNKKFFALNEMNDWIIFRWNKWQIQISFELNIIICMFFSLVWFGLVCVVSRNGKFGSFFEW